LPVWDYPNLAPSVCFICEGAEPGAKFLDTFKDYTSGGIFSPLNGRKYLCSHCVKDAADEFGMFDEARETYLASLATHAAHIVELEDKLKAYSHLDAVLTKLSDAAPKKAHSAKALKKTETTEA
jgi:hypothetical protein